jgi:hypothetical protein
MVELASIPVEFSLGKPFLPYEQLLAVQPSSSHRLLPPPYQRLMTDPASPIVDFYPTEFRVDMEGKREPGGQARADAVLAAGVCRSGGPDSWGGQQAVARRGLLPGCASSGFGTRSTGIQGRGLLQTAHPANPCFLRPYFTSCPPPPGPAGADWEGVVLIPFIDEQRLLSAAASVPQQRLSEEERQRNRLGDIVIFSHSPGARALARVLVGAWVSQSSRDSAARGNRCTPS